MSVLNLGQVAELLGFSSPASVRRLLKRGVLEAYRRSGPDGRSTYLETEPEGLPTLKQQVQAHTQCHFSSPLWRRESLPETMSDQALDAAMEPINEWIEGRDQQGWEARAAEFIDPSCWGPPPWTAQQWLNLRSIIQLAEDS